MGRLGPGLDQGGFLFLKAPHRLPGPPGLGGQGFPALPVVAQEALGTGQFFGLGRRRLFLGRPLGFGPLPVPV